MYPYGIVQVCPDHVPGCKPNDYISRDRWGRVGGLTYTEQRSHFSFWCMLAAPLILGNDPRHMSSDTLSILLADEVVALNQDSLGKQALLTWSHDQENSSTPPPPSPSLTADDADATSLSPPPPPPPPPIKAPPGPAEVWIKPLSDGRVSALIFNPGNEARDIALIFRRDMKEAAAKWARENVTTADSCKDKSPDCPRWAKDGECDKNVGFMLDKCPYSCPKGCPQGPPEAGPVAVGLVRDVWAKEDLGAFVGRWTAHLVEPHASRVVTITFMEPKEAFDKDVLIKKAQSEGAQGHQAAWSSLRMKQKIIEAEVEVEVEAETLLKEELAKKADGAKTDPPTSNRLVEAEDSEVDALRSEVKRLQLELEEEKEKVKGGDDEGSRQREALLLSSFSAGSMASLGGRRGRMLKIPTQGEQGAKSGASEGILPSSASTSRPLSSFFSFLKPKSHPSGAGVGAGDSSEVFFWLVCGGLGVALALFVLACMFCGGATRPDHRDVPDKSF